MLSAFCLTAPAATLTVNPSYTVTDFGLTTNAVRRVTLTPISPGGDYTNAFLAPRPIASATYTNGVATFTNIVSGYAYALSLETVFSTTRRTNYFPSTLSGDINGGDYLAWLAGFATDGRVLQWAWLNITNLSTGLSLTNGNLYYVTNTGAITFNGQILTNGWRDVTNFFTQAGGSGSGINVAAGSRVTATTNGGNTLVTVSADAQTNATLGALAITGAITNVVAGSNATVQIANGIATVNAIIGGSNSPMAGAFLTPTNSLTTNVWTHNAGSLTNLLPTTFGAFYTNQLAVTGGVFTAFSYPHLTIVTNTYSLSSNAVVAEISAPNLTAAGLVTIDLDASVTNIDLRSLTYVNGEFYVGDMDALTNINLASLTAVGGIFFIEDNIALTDVSLPAFVSAYGASFAVQSDGGVGVPAVTNFSAPRWILRPAQSVLFINTALTAASVNHILARGVASGVTNCLIDTSQGGMNAAPTGQGSTDKATLISRGNSVTTN